MLNMQCETAKDAKDAKKMRTPLLLSLRPLRFVFAVVCLTTITGCDKDSVASDADAMTGGDWKKGALAIQDNGCASCHTIPGIHGADSKVGPPLTGISQRTYLAGILQNTPENLVKWIQNPPKIDDRTAMPNTHLSESDARDIASYLYTLR
jgi:cytochrome c2